MKRIFVVSIPLLILFGFLTLPGCGDPSEVFGDPPPVPSPSGAGNGSSDEALTSPAPPGVTVRVQGGAGAVVTTTTHSAESDTGPAVDDPPPGDDMSEGETDTSPLVVDEQQKSDEEPNTRLPMTYICFRGGHPSFAYYLYKPGHGNHVCELYYQNSDKYYYADWERDFCEKKLLEHLKEKILFNYTCMCGSPAGPTGMVVLTEDEEDYKCEETGKSD